MAISQTAKNAMLQGLKDHSESPNGTKFYIRAGNTSGDNYYEEATYGTPTNGEMNITGNVVINIEAGKTITQLTITKGETNVSTHWTVASKTLPVAQVFDYAGTITITSAKITLTDAT